MWRYCAAARITMRSPSFTSVTFVSTSVPSTCCQAFSIRRLMAEARSGTDFLWVHSSRISPSRSMNMTEPAVAKSPHHRHGDGGGIQHGNGQLSVPQGQKPFFDVLCGADHSQRRHHRRRQKQVGSAAAYNSEGELVLKFPIQGGRCAPVPSPASPHFRSSASNVHTPQGIPVYFITCRRI